MCGARKRWRRAPPARPATARSSGFLDLDLLRCRFGRFRNCELQDSIGHRGLDARWVDTRGQLQHAQEYAIAAPAELNVFVLLIFLDPLLYADRHGIVLDRGRD